MADFDQQNQQVNSQWNAGGDINAPRFSTRIYNTATKASTALVRGIVTIVVLLLLGTGVAFAFPAIESLLGKVWHATQNISPNAMLYGNPKSSLEQFCQNIQSGDPQGAYNDYSAHLQAQISLADFTNTWHQQGEVVTNCVSEISTRSDTSASGKLLISTETINAGVTNNSSTYKVTLVSSDGIWRIDAMDKQ